MRKEELRIGNLINRRYADDNIVPDVISIHDLWHGYLTADVRHVVEWNAISAISLTDEWLLDFGFKRDSKYSHTFILNDFEISEWNNKFATWYITHLNCEKTSEIYSHIKYVHELQNLYFALTGEELIRKEK